MDFNQQARRIDRESDVAEGIFCDCYGTIFGHSFGVDAELVAYLNSKHAAGETVRLISSDASPGMRDKLITCGLDPELCRRLTDKRRLDGEILETLIDDDPPSWLRARTRWKPSDPAFRAMLRRDATMTPAGP